MKRKAAVSLLKKHSENRFLPNGFLEAGLQTGDAETKKEIEIPQPEGSSCGIFMQAGTW